MIITIEMFLAKITGFSEDIICSVIATTMS